ncbi:ficolin-2-like [Saccostrea cucullata]|uniref:ficolin-2-like n=1 Tax=Saccostrea cuccullata TaxID=36930 RepID=UPI002ECFBB82
MPGNDTLHLLTKNGKHEFRVDLQRFNGQKGYAKYSSFAVGGEESKYKLSVSGHSGIDDSLIHHSGMRFTTKDQDNGLSSSNCTVHYIGGWWYESCYRSNLKGLYAQSPMKSNKNNKWYSWFHKALKRSTMMMRPSV